ncbi:hypothetical protein ACHWQZ_G008581 [Mnemiopsis leidyi]
MNDSNDKKMTDKKTDSTRNKVVKSPEKTPSSSDNEFLCPCKKYIGESDNEENNALRVIIKEELQLFAPKLTNSLNNVINGSTEKTVNKAVHLYSEVTAKSQRFIWCSSRISFRSLAFHFVCK